MADHVPPEASIGALQVVLATLLGGSVLFGLYSLLVFLVTSFGQVLHGGGVGSDSDTHSDLPGLEGSQSQGHGGGGRGGGRERGRHIQLDVNEVHYPVSYWTEKGGRPYQEDRLDIRHGSCPRNSDKRHCVGEGGVLPDTSLYGVYDGHGGSVASHHCSEHLLTRLIEFAFPVSTSSEDSSEVSDTRVSANKLMDATRQAFRSVDDSFTILSEERNLTDGSTAVVAVIHDGQLIVGNAGDSRCILVQRGGRAKAMSDDHKPSREDEERRIKQLGGRVIFWGIWRVEGVLAVSRAIGDVPLKPYITAEPDVVYHDLRNDTDTMFVVLASDGLFDVMSSEEVAHFVARECQKSDFKSVARNLCDEAMLLGSLDNITVQVIDVRKKESLRQYASKTSLRR